MASAAFFCHGNELATVTTATATLATAANLIRFQFALTTTSGSQDDSSSNNNTAATTTTGNGTTSTSMESFLALAKSWEKLYC